MIYFDNSATTRVLDNVIEKMTYVMREQFGNPSSLHSFGFSAEKEITNSKKIISKIINASENEIFFTSGGTEANNLAVFGIVSAHKKRGNHLIVSKIEHPSVLEAYKKLESMGYDVSYIDCDEKGYVDTKQLENAINEKTIIVSIMHINNEIGTIQNIEEISKIIKEKNSKTFFHVDCVQSFCKHKINSKFADLITFSGHKIHAPKGIGGIFIKKGVRLEPVFIGGKQQNAIRSGTENVPGIVGLAAAAEYMSKNLEKNFNRVFEVKNELKKIKDLIPDVCINGDEENGSPYILNLSFKDVKGEVLLHTLEDRDIFVSTGSACSSNHKKHIGTVDIIGGVGENSLRFSFSDENTVDEAKKCVSALLEIVPMLRQYRQL